MNWLPVGVLSSKGFAVIGLAMLAVCAPMLAWAATANITGLGGLLVGGVGLVGTVYGGLTALVGARDLVTEPKTIPYVPPTPEEIALERQRQKERAQEIPLLNVEQKPLNPQKNSWVERTQPEITMPSAIIR
jgi:hypothetical protein